MKNSRTAKSVANIATSISNNILTIVAKFLVRTVFIYYFQKEYLGLNGLFSSIISMLSLADLGFSIALPYSLYKPLAENDKKKIKAIMNYFSKVYKVVGLVVILAGVALIPFLPLIIKDMPNIANITLIYILFILNSAASYFFVYKKTLIIADQKDYKVKLIESISVIITCVLQMFMIVTTQNYILYLMIAIITTLLQNYYVSRLANKLYPFIKDKNNELLEKSDRKILSKNTVVLFFYKVANVIETGIDNIIISTVVSINAVGIYSNYSLIIGSVKNLLMTATNSITSSIGNIASEKNTEKSYLLFRIINTLSVILYGICAITIYIMINPFIDMWIGDGYLFSSPTVFVLCINFYIFGSQNTLGSFRNAYGLFWEGRFRPLVMTILNLIFSLLLVNSFGLAGVITGTIISRILSVGLMDSYVIYKNIFKKKVWKYHLMKITQAVIVLFIGIAVNYISSFIIVEGIISWILKAIIIVIITSGCFMLVFWRSEEMQYFKCLLLSLIN